MRLIVFVVASVFPSRRDMTRVLLDTHIHRENTEYIYIYRKHIQRDGEREGDILRAYILACLYIYIYLRESCGHLSATSSSF